MASFNATVACLVAASTAVDGCAGGDWGSIISATLARQYPERCRAIHINMVFAGPCYRNPLHLLQLANLLPGLRRFPVFLSRDEMQSVQDGRYFQEHETGASHDPSHLAEHLDMCCEAVYSSSLACLIA